MPRGGRRTGTPGKSYPNRVDLSTVKPPAAVAPSTQYGEAAASMRAQQAVPVAPPPMPDLPPMTRPTERPNEPVTAGIAAGPGPGPEAVPDMGNTSLDFLRGVYSRFPDEHLRSLIEAMDAGEY